ncbi:MAG TPA: hypothetical protein VGD17_15175 [Chitinophagaceae bacterium]
MRKHFFLFSVLSFFVISILAQEPQVNDSIVKANLVSYYHSSFQEQQGLYNGIEHSGYSPVIKGHAYYLTRDWQKGTVWYDGIFYKDVSLLYDIYKDQVVIRHSNEIYIIGLVSSKVSAFTISGLRFKRLSIAAENIQAGFYELLFEGKLTVLAKRSKKLREYINVKMEYEFLDQDQLIIEKDGTYNIIRKESNLIDVLGDQRALVKQYLRKNKIRFRDNPQQAIILAVEYYESLKR